MRGSTNVDYYVSGFDSTGKRVGSIICDFDPNKEKNSDKLSVLIDKAKGLFSLAIVCTSSIEGANFQGAVGSQLLVDELHVLVDEE